MVSLAEDDVQRLLKALGESVPINVPDKASRSPAARARHELTERRRRRDHFPEGLFGEVGWEILLLLYIEREGRRYTVTALAEALDLPQNTTGRWLKMLQQEGLVVRAPHRLDQRATIGEISDAGVAAIEKYYANE